LLARYEDACDIEIAGAGLEDAFLELTADDAADGSAADGRDVGGRAGDGRGADGLGAGEGVIR
jgi:hypothetical protein